MFYTIDDLGLFVRVKSKLSTFSTTFNFSVSFYSSFYILYELIDILHNSGNKLEKKVLNEFKIWRKITKTFIQLQSHSKAF